VKLQPVEATYGPFTARIQVQFTGSRVADDGRPLIGTFRINREFRVYGRPVPRLLFRAAVYAYVLLRARPARGVTTEADGAAADTSEVTS
jgi:hypothetical protein